MIPLCPKCGKDNFKSNRDQIFHLNYQVPCTPRIIEISVHLAASLNLKSTKQL
jgi:hypothetical protein